MLMTRRAKARALNSTGDTILEVLIAIAVVSSVLGSVFALANRTSQNARQVQEHQEALKYASSQIELLANYIKRPNVTQPTGASFCIDQTALTPVDYTGDAPASCKVNAGAYEYSLKLSYDATNKVYTSSVTWPGATGSTDSLSLTYRTQVNAGSYDENEIVVGTPPSTPPSTPSSECVRIEPNFVNAGSFSNVNAAGNGPNVNAAAGFDSDLPNRGPNAYPDDDGSYGASTGWTGGLSLIDITSANKADNRQSTYGGVPSRQFLWNGTWDQIVGTQLSDPAYGIAPTNTFFYSNPNQTKTMAKGTQNNAGFTGVLWRTHLSQTLIAGKTYSFTTYFQSLLDPSTDGNASVVKPKVELRVNGIPVSDMQVGTAGTSGYSTVAAPYSVPADRKWHRITIPFTPNSSQVNNVMLEIFDYAGGINGDDFGMTGISFYECV